MPKLVTLLRVKDGILFIKEWLFVMENISDEIVVVDNGSTDGTVEILKSSKKVVDIKITEGFNEGRDKILVYEMARKRNPDWCIWLDVDEIFEQRLTRQKIEKMMSSRIISKYLFRRYHFFNDLNNFEASKESQLEVVFPSRAMWKETPNAYFKDLKIHNGGIQGIKGVQFISKYRIKHITNIFKEYRSKVYDNYILIDPSRKEMYQKQKDDLVNNRMQTKRWYEYHERPLAITIEYHFLNIEFLVRVLYKKLFQ